MRLPLIGHRDAAMGRQAILPLASSPPLPLSRSPTLPLSRSPAAPLPRSLSLSLIVATTTAFLLQPAGPALAAGAPCQPAQAAATVTVAPDDARTASLSRPF